MSHAAIAKARGLPVRAIALFALGGVAQIEREAGEASTEFFMGDRRPDSQHADRGALPDAGLDGGLAARCDTCNSNYRDVDVAWLHQYRARNFQSGARLSTGWRPSIAR